MCNLLAAICNQSPIPIALDEELIGVHFENSKADLLQHIKPQYIILKPSLVGGWQGADQWVSIAEKQSIGWWATSALESNIGLNAIAQWLSTKEISMPQGLGTGGLGMKYQVALETHAEETCHTCTSQRHCLAR